MAPPGGRKIFSGPPENGAQTLVGAYFELKIPIENGPDGLRGPFLGVFRPLGRGGPGGGSPPPLRGSQTLLVW